MNQLLCSVTVKEGDKRWIYHCQNWQQKPCKAVLMCLTHNVGLWMKGKALMCTCRTDWVNYSILYCCSLNAMFKCSPVNCPLFSSPQHKPGSDRSKGRTLLSSVRWETYMTVSTSRKVKNSTFGDMCLAHLICCVQKKRLKVFVLVTVCVPEEPDVYENKDMLCWGHCDSSVFLEQRYSNTSLRSQYIKFPQCHG